MRSMVKKEILVRIGISVVILLALFAVFVISKQPAAREFEAQCDEKKAEETEVENEMKMRLSNVDVAIVYQRVTDGRGRGMDGVINILEETKTDFIFRGWWRYSMPCPESSDDAAPEELEAGYTYQHLTEAVDEIKEEIPDIIFCGAIPAQRMNIREKNPLTGETIEEAGTWEMAADPAKWEIGMSRTDFQKRMDPYIVGGGGNVIFS